MYLSNFGWLSRELKWTSYDEITKQQIMEYDSYSYSACIVCSV